MTNTGTDSRGRKNPCAWQAWARGAEAPEDVRTALGAAFSSNRARSSGCGSRARRALKRANAIEPRIVTQVDTWGDERVVGGFGGAFSGDLIVEKD